MKKSQKDIHKRRKWSCHGTNPLKYVHDRPSEQAINYFPPTDINPDPQTSQVQR
jgi:hypothetical protein